jgi:ubiquitin-protein ligase
LGSYGLPLSVKLGLYTAGIFLLIIIPTSFFDSGPSICLFKNIFHVNCPGCGMTRAISSIFHGRWLMAFQYNKLVVVVFPLLVFISLKTIIKDFRNQCRTVRKNQNNPT